MFIPFGVGGLTLGVSSILKSLMPGIVVIAVETDACPTLKRALQAKMPITVTKQKTCADAIGTPRVVERVYEMLTTAEAFSNEEKSNLIDGVVSVSESDLIRAMKLASDNLNVRIEGAAAAALAAAMGSDFTRPLALITGQNIDPKLVQLIVEKFFAQ